MFADFDLAHRIEAAEASLSREAAEASARRGATRDVFVRPLAGGVAVFTGADSPITKVIGVGFGGVPSAQEWTDIEGAFFEHHAAVRAEVATLADPGVGAALTRRRYVLEGFENVLGHLVGGAACPEIEGVDVEKTTDARTWKDVLIEGFAHPDTGVLSAPDETFPTALLERIYDDMAGAAGYTRYLARIGGQPAGGASVRICGRIAQMTGAATLPAHRRRGVQTALFNARLREAARAGCDVAVVTTQPGSKSQQNAQRRGFTLLYARAVLVKNPGT